MNRKPISLYDKIIRSLLYAQFFLVFGGCTKTDIISPEGITQIEYYYLFGLSGSVSKLSIMPLESVFTQLPKPGIECRRFTTIDQWQNLLRDIDWESYRKEPSSADPGGCCDRSAAGIKVITRNGVHEVNREFLPRDSTALGKLSARLSQRLTDQTVSCR